MSDKITSNTLVDLLRERHPSGEWAFFEQLANGTGSHANRWADAVAMNLWPSRGMALHGFEVKISRTDWKKELAQPEKAEEIAQYCDYWWIVVSAGTLVAPGELPDGWGLMAYAKKADDVIIEKALQEGRAEGRKAAEASGAMQRVMDRNRALEETFQLTSSVLGEQLSSNWLHVKEGASLPDFEVERIRTLAEVLKLASVGDAQANCAVKNVLERHEKVGKALAELHAAMLEKGA